MRAPICLMVVGCLTLASNFGCEGKTEAEDTNAASETGITPIDTEQPSTSPGSESTAATSIADGDASADSASDGADTTESTTTTTGEPVGEIPCGNKIFACGDGIDNDGDGFIDLLDPECTGPCDDDESSFQTGIPGDNVDCRQDCFFDGNSGQGDDGCLWDLRCDPTNPGEHIGCAYTGGNNCNNQPPHQTQACIDFCSPLTPPGCDCFGCCTIDTPDGPIDIFLNSHPDCSLSNLDACTQCTSQIDDCGNTCEPENCEICFGQTAPMEGCGSNTCVSGNPCNPDQNNCPETFFCYLGCCYPPPPG